MKKSNNVVDKDVYRGYLEAIPYRINGIEFEDIDCVKIYLAEQGMDDVEIDEYINLLIDEYLDGEPGRD